MERIRVQRRPRVETGVERRDRIAPIRDLDARDRDILRAKALLSGLGHVVQRQGH